METWLVLAEMSQEFVKNPVLIYDCTFFFFYAKLSSIISQLL